MFIAWLKQKTKENSFPICLTFLCLQNCVITGRQNMKNGKVRQNRKKNSVYKKRKYKRNNAMKKWKLYPIEGDKFKHKISRKPTNKKKRIKSKRKSMSEKIIRKKNEQST